MTRLHLASAAAVAAAGALVCAFAAHRKAAGGDTQGTAAASAVEKLLRDKDAALAKRVVELAGLPRLPLALATDAETVGDLTSDELTFRPRPGESITIAQRFRDGHTVILLALPGAATPEVGAPGAHARIGRGGIVLSHALEVAPSERADELTGNLTVTHVVEGRELALPLLAASRSARLTIGDDAMDVGDAWEPAGQQSSYPVPLPGGASATLLLAGGGRTGGTLLWGIVGVLALLSLALSIRAITDRGPNERRRDDPPWDDPPRVPPTPESTALLRAPVPTPVPATSILEPTALEPTALESTALLPTDAPVTATPASRPMASEQRIGRYAIIRQLGQGGMADVFLARSEGEAGFGKVVAFKVLQPIFAAHPVALNLFLDEARLVSGLDHPNIVQTHDLGRAGDRYFIAMEYVDGMDLAHLVIALRQRGERMPLPFALAILCRICDGLHAAHMATGPDGHPLYLVHRDVKSANVFLSRTGAVKIGDFGIAKASHTVRMSRTELGQVKGTPGTMAPEQRLGKDVDLRADVYGVGAIAYEILSGEAVNLDYVALAEQGAKGWPHLPPLSASRADVPKELDAIIFRALAFTREARFPSCAVLEQELNALAATAGLANDKDIGAWVRSEVDRKASAR